MKCSSLIFLKKKKHAQYLLRNSNQNQNVNTLTKTFNKFQNKKKNIDNF